MFYKPVLSFLILPVIISSCFEPIQVVINNKSTVERNIRVRYPGHLSHPINSTGQTNEFQAYDHTLTANAISTRDIYRYPVKIPVQSLDTVNRTYSFQLKAKHEVIVETRWKASVPTYGQVFIIDDTDTVELKRRGKLFKKRGGSWTYTIK